MEGLFLRCQSWQFMMRNMINPPFRNTFLEYFHCNRFGFSFVLDQWGSEINIMISLNMVGKIEFAQTEQ